MPNQLLEFFKHLKTFEKKLLAECQRSSFRSSDFAGLSSAKLKEINIHQTFDAEAMIRHILSNHRHPDIHHYDLNFTKNIQFTLLRNKAFFIDVYLWMDHTEIHAHNFTGCFQVMHGNFTQTRYAFEKGHVGEKWNLGKLSLIARERLDPGTVYAIKGGETFIHQVYHFDQPSISLCVRTDNTTKPYYSYFYPGLRLQDTSFKRPHFLRMKALQQLSVVNAGLSQKDCFELLKGLPVSPLMNEYLLGIPTLKLEEKAKLELESAIETHLRKEIKIDIKDIRRKNLVHMTKLEMSPV